MEAINTIWEDEVILSVMYINTAISTTIIPVVAIILAPYLSESLPIIGLRRLPTTYPGIKRSEASSGDKPLTPWRYMITRKTTER